MNTYSFPLCTSSVSMASLVVLAYFPEGAGQEEEDDRPRVAIVGKPNVGKSSIINRLIGKYARTLSSISPIPIRSDAEIGTGSPIPIQKWQICSDRKSVV